MATKHSVGDRLYVMSNDELHPSKRVEETETLVFISHGYWTAPEKKAAVAGVGQVWFACAPNGTTDPDDFEADLKKGAKCKFTLFQNNKDWRFKAGDKLTDYTFKKESDKDAKTRNKGKLVNFEFVNQTYIEEIYPSDAKWDLACLHNTWKSGRTLQLSEIFKTLSSKELTGKYTRLLIGSCREAAT